MAYIGRQLARGTNKLFDDISSSFNGSTTTFNLTVASVATSTATPYQLFVSLGGVMQKPGTDFTTAGNQITFTTAPAAGISCWIMMQGDSIDQAAIPDGVVTASKIANSGDFAFPADIRLKDGDGSHYVGFEAPTTVSANKVWTLPAADGSANQVLTTNGSGVLTWSTIAGGVTSNAQYNTVGGTSAGAALNSTSLRNTLFGYQAGTALTDSGSSNQANDNTAVGYQALKNANGNWAVSNTAIGRRALYSSTTAQDNTAIGYGSSYTLTTGNGNTSVGLNAGYFITTGTYNTILGHSTNSRTTTGTYNISIGQGAGGPTTGSDNICIGRQTGTGLTTNGNNVIIGYQSGKDVTTGYDNTFVAGRQAGGVVTTGYKNTFIGRAAGYGITTGNENICLGDGAYASSATVSFEATIGSAQITKFRIPGINFVLKDNGGTPSSGQVLTADGSGEGYWAAAGGGAWEVISTHDLSSSAAGSSSTPLNNRGWNNTTYRVIKAVFVGVALTTGVSKPICQIYSGSNGSNGTLSNQNQYKMCVEEQVMGSNTRVDQSWTSTKMDMYYNNPSVINGEVVFTLMQSVGSSYSYPTAYYRYISKEYDYTGSMAYLGTDTTNNYMVGAAFFDNNGNDWNTGKVVWMGLKV